MIVRQVYDSFDYDICSLISLNKTQLFRAYDFLCYFCKNI